MTGPPSLDPPATLGVHRGLVLSPSSASRAVSSEDGREADSINDHGHNGAVDDAQLSDITDVLVELHERYHGRKPATAKSLRMGDDMIACLMGEIYTDVEKTMIELQRQALVHQMRSEFQQAMERRFISAVETITSRRVQTFISTHHVGPDLELELFVLEPSHGF